MPAAAPIIAAVAAPTLTGAIIRVGLSLAVSYVTNKLFAPDVPQSNSDASTAADPGVRQRISTDTSNKLPVAYGESKVFGSITYATISSDNQKMAFIIPVCEGPISSFNTIYWDNWTLSFGGEDITTGLRPVTNATDLDGTTTDDFLNEQRLQVRAFPRGGACTDMVTFETDNITNSADRKWATNSANRLMPDVAYLYCELEYDRDHGTTGLTSKFGAAINGKLVNAIVEKEATYVAYQARVTVAADQYTEEQWDALGSIYRDKALTYSNNPAECLADFLTSKVYGCGNIISETDMGLQSFYNHKVYCETHVAYKDSTGATVAAGDSTRDRFNLNGVVNTNDTRDLTISDICNNSQGILSYQLGQFDLNTDRMLTTTEVSSAQSFNEDNVFGTVTVVNDGFNSQLNRFTGSFNSKDAMYQDDQIYLDIPDDLKNTNEPEFIQDTRFKFINNNVQAERIGYTVLRKSRDTQLVSFTTDIRALNLSINDPISFSNESYNIKNKVYRVNSIEETTIGDGLLGYKITAKEYNASAYNDDTSNPFQDFAEAPNVTLPNPNSIGRPTAFNIVTDGKNTAAGTIGITVEPEGNFTEALEFFYYDNSDATYTLPNDVPVGSRLFLGTRVRPQGGSFTAGNAILHTILDVPASSNLYLYVRGSNSYGFRGEFAALDAGPFTRTIPDAITNVRVIPVFKRGTVMPANSDAPTENLTFDFATSTSTFPAAATDVSGVRFRINSITFQDTDAAHSLSLEFPSSLTSTSNSDTLWLQQVTTLPSSFTPGGYSVGGGAIRAYFIQDTSTVSTPSEFLSNTIPILSDNINNATAPFDQYVLTIDSEDDQSVLIRRADGTALSATDVTQGFLDDEFDITISDATISVPGTATVSNGWHININNADGAGEVYERLGTVTNLDNVIEPNEWSGALETTTPVTGQDGVSYSDLRLYKKTPDTASAVFTAPESITYSFDNDEITESTALNGWAREIPTIGTGDEDSIVYFIQVRLNSSLATDGSLEVTDGWTEAAALTNHQFTVPIYGVFRDTDLAVGNFIRRTSLATQSDGFVANTHTGVTYINTPINEAQLDEVVGSTDSQLIITPVINGTAQTNVVISGFTAAEGNTLRDLLNELTGKSTDFNFFGDTLEAKLTLSSAVNSYTFNIGTTSDQNIVVGADANIQFGDGLTRNYPLPTVSGGGVKDSGLVTRELQDLPDFVNAVTTPTPNFAETDTTRHDFVTQAELTALELTTDFAYRATLLNDYNELPSEFEVLRAQAEVLNGNIIGWSNFEQFRFRGAPGVDGPRNLTRYGKFSSTRFALDSAGDLTRDASGTDTAASNADRNDGFWVSNPDLLGTDANGDPNQFTHTRTQFGVLANGGSSSTRSFKLTGSIDPSAGQPYVNTQNYNGVTTNVQYAGTPERSWTVDSGVPNSATTNSPVDPGFTRLYNLPVGTTPGNPIFFRANSYQAFTGRVTSTDVAPIVEASGDPTFFGDGDSQLPDSDSGTFGRLILTCNRSDVIVPREGGLFSSAWDPDLPNEPIPQSGLGGLSERINLPKQGTLRMFQRLVNSQPDEDGGGEDIIYTDYIVYYASGNIEGQDLIEFVFKLHPSSAHPGIGESSVNKTFSHSNMGWQGYLTTKNTTFRTSGGFARNAPGNIRRYTASVAPTGNFDMRSPAGTGTFDYYYLRFKFGQNLFYYAQLELNFLRDTLVNNYETWTDSNGLLTGVAKYHINNAKWYKGDGTTEPDWTSFNWPPGSFDQRQQILRTYFDNRLSFSDASFESFNNNAFNGNEDNLILDFSALATGDRDDILAALNNGSNTENAFDDSGGDNRFLSRIEWYAFGSGSSTSPLTGQAWNKLYTINNIQATQEADRPRSSLLNPVPDSTDGPLWRYLDAVSIRQPFFIELYDTTTQIAIQVENASGDLEDSITETVWQQNQSLEDFLEDLQEEVNSKWQSYVPTGSSIVANGTSLEIPFNTGIADIGNVGVRVIPSPDQQVGGVDFAPQLGEVAADTFLEEGGSIGRRAKTIFNIAADSDIATTITTDNTFYITHAFASEPLVYNYKGGENTRTLLYATIVQRLEEDPNNRDRNDDQIITAAIETEENETTGLSFTYTAGETVGNFSGAQLNLFINFGEGVLSGDDGTFAITDEANTRLINYTQRNGAFGRLIGGTMNATGPGIITQASKFVEVDLFTFGRNFASGNTNNNGNGGYAAFYAEGNPEPLVLAYTSAAIQGNGVDRLELLRSPTLPEVQANYFLNGNTVEIFPKSIMFNNNSIAEPYRTLYKNYPIYMDDDRNGELIVDHSSTRLQLENIVRTMLPNLYTITRPFDNIIENTSYYTRLDGPEDGANDGKVAGTDYVFFSSDIEGSPERNVALNHTVPALINNATSIEIDIVDLKAPIPSSRGELIVVTNPTINIIEDNTTAGLGTYIVQGQDTNRYTYLTSNITSDRTKVRFTFAEDVPLNANATDAIFMSVNDNFIVPTGENESLVTINLTRSNSSEYKNVTNSVILQAPTSGNDTENVWNVLTDQDNRHFNDLGVYVDVVSNNLDDSTDPSITFDVQDVSTGPTHFEISISPSPGYADAAAIVPQTDNNPGTPVDYNEGAEDGFKANRWSRPVNTGRQV